jgi:hypothetical protein
VQPPKHHVFRRPGEYEIVFELRSGDQVLRDRLLVVVHGVGLSR